jgi:hypothetical protein
MRYTMKKPNTELGLPRPEVESLDPPRPSVPELEMPTDLHAAFALVQRLQREFELLPNASREQQRARWAAMQKLENAKRVCARLQQGPEAPNGADALNRTLAERRLSLLESILTIREQVQRRMKTQAR